MVSLDLTGHVVAVESEGADVLVEHFDWFH